MLGGKKNNTPFVHRDQALNKHQNFQQLCRAEEQHRAEMLWESGEENLQRWELEIASAGQTQRMQP